MKHEEDSADLPAHDSAETLVGTRVRDFRKARGWTQTDLAIRLTEHGLDLHQTTVAKLESGRRPVRVNELVAVADVLGVPVPELLHDPASDPERRQALHDLMTADRRRHNAEMAYREAEDRLGEVAKELELARKERTAASDRFNELQRQTRERKETSGGGQHQETT